MTNGPGPTSGLRNTMSAARADRKAASSRLPPWSSTWLSTRKDQTWGGGGPEARGARHRHRTCAARAMCGYVRLCGAQDVCSYVRLCAAMWGTGRVRHGLCAEVMWVPMYSEGVYEKQGCPGVRCTLRNLQERQCTLWNLSEC